MDRDQKLIAHLDARLEACMSHIDAKFEGVDRRFEGMEGQIREMQGQIRENAAHVDRRFDETHEQIRKNRIRIDNTKVVVEELHSKIETVAEGHVMLDGKLDRYYEEVKVERQLDRGETRSSIKRLRERVDRLEAAR